MPTTNPSFGEHTPAETVASAFPSQIKDQVILITGANIKGIGGATALALAAQKPRMLIFAGRSPHKIDEMIQAVKAVNADIICKSLSLDVTSQQSCREAAKTILQSSDVSQIDILINNAGMLGAPTRELSPDGTELSFAVNYLGPFLFTSLLLPKLLVSAKQSSVKGRTRIVNVSSMALVTSPVRFSDINMTKTDAQLPESERPDRAVIQHLWGAKPDPNTTYDYLVGYGQAKSALTLFARELNRKLYNQHGIFSIALHPGAIMTEAMGKWDQSQQAEMHEALETHSITVKSLSAGASTTMVAALDPALTPEDRWLDNCQATEVPKAWAKDDVAADKLWKLSEELVGETFQI